MIPETKVIPGVKFTREFFKLLKIMLGEYEGMENTGSIAFFCPYYEEGKYVEGRTEEGWPVPENFDEMTYPFKLFVGPANNKNLHKLSVIQNPQSEGYEDNLLEILDMTEAGDDADIKDGKKIGNMTAEQAYDYLLKKYKECEADWLKEMPWY